jgi:hypothetical protein
MRHKRYLFVLIIVLSTSCATKRPIIFRDPSFKDYKVLTNRCAFIIWDSININSVVQDFISAFDGNPAIGESFIRAYLSDCLTGRQKVAISDQQNYLKLSLFSLDSIKTDLTFSQDKYEIATLTVLNSDSLASIFSTSRADYLIVFYGLTVKRGAAAYGGPMAGVQNFPIQGMTTVIGGGDVKFATISSQVFVIRTESMSVVWNGFVSGKCSIGLNFTKNTAKGVVEGFVRDLWSVLR